MKTITLFMIGAIASITSQARTQWSLGPMSVNVDTVFHAAVGPGTTQTQLRLTGQDDAGWTNNVFYTTTDLSAPHVEMRAAKAGNHMRMLETVPEIAGRFSAPGQEYFAGINADFFNMGYPYNSIGASIANGALTNHATVGADIDSYYIYFNKDGIPSMARHITIDPTGTVTFADGSTATFYINRTRDANTTVLYTPQWQAASHQAGMSGTNSYGTEIAVRPVSQGTMFGNTLEMEVTCDPVAGVGNMSISDDGFVLSAHGTAQNAIKKLKAGDLIKLFVGFKALKTETSAKEVLGGFPIILNGGQPTATPSYPGHLSGPEPRTAVGYDATHTRVTMLVVDGRNARGSAGVNQLQLAYIMKRLGCVEAMNFDGGGSSSLYIAPLGLRNVPSSSSLDSRPEGKPRTVVNALFAVSTAPEDNEIASIEMRDKQLHLSTGVTYRPVIYGYNRYGVLIDSDVAGCTISVADEIGTVSDDGTITGGTGRFNGPLTVTCDGLSHTIPVYLNGGGEYVTADIEPIFSDTTHYTPEYYTTTGIRINEPVKGQIVIERRGPSVRKLIMR